jgi:exopolyphosphatase/guanosine-5'-triphosphate,3'-diphosphate pyrophosphatase
MHRALSPLRPARPPHRSSRRTARSKRDHRKPKPKTPHGLRIAAIDIGTNSLHMIVVEVTPNLAFKTLSSDKDPTHLGDGALVKRRLTSRAIDHTLDALARYQKIAQGLDADVLLAYATSAVRESANGGDFVDLARRRLRLPVQVISAREEAHLIYLAVRSAIDLDCHPASGEHGSRDPDSRGPALILDIGGGSAELIVATNERPLLLESQPLGASRLAQQFLHADPVSNKDLAALQSHIKKSLKPALQQIRELAPRHLIGTSGTLENLAAMAALRHGESAARHRLLTHMSRDDFADLYKQLRKLPLKERRRLPGMDPDRAAQIPAGAAVLDHLFDKLPFTHIDVCDRALREGMIIDYMHTHWPKIKLSVQYPDPRRRSVFELARRCNFDEKHASQVAALSLQLFDSLEKLHRLSRPERELLEFAALLHDIGWHIGHSGHHKHSAYLIKNGDLEGFSPHELDLLANIARYHRKSPPKKSHPDFQSLDPASQLLVRKLASLLRIADGLDRGHYSNVQSVSTRTTTSSVTIRIHAQHDAALELWAARHKTDMFEQTFHHRVAIKT